MPRAGARPARQAEPNIARLAAAGQRYGRRILGPPPGARHHGTRGDLGRRRFAIAPEPACVDSQAGKPSPCRRGAMLAVTGIAESRDHRLGCWCLGTPALDARRGTCQTTDTQITGYLISGCCPEAAARLTAGARSGGMPAGLLPGRRSARRGAADGKGEVSWLSGRTMARSSAGSGNSGSGTAVTSASRHRGLGG